MKHRDSSPPSNLWSHYINVDHSDHRVAVARNYS